MTPTFSQIKAQVNAIRRKRPNTQRIAIRASGQWSKDYEEADLTYRVQSCPSPLAIRLALRQELPESVIQVLITDLEEQDLEEDILLRLPKQRLFQIESWQVIQDLFQARRIDPRLIQHRWIAECLMEWAPPSGYPPALGSFLDADTVWSILLDKGLGLKGDRPDLVAILRWSMNPDHIRQFRTVIEPLQTGAIEHLVELAGTAARPVLQCIARHEVPVGLPLGLALGALFHEQVENQVDRAIGKLEERYLGGRSLSKEDALSWYHAATEVIKLQLPDSNLKLEQLRAAEEILCLLGAEDSIQFSDILPKGLDQRLALFGQQVLEQLDHPQNQNFTELVKNFQSLQNHYFSRQEVHRIHRTEMALRLMNWLAQQSQTEKTTEARFLEQAVSHYLKTGAYLDWARLKLRSGDPVPVLSQAYNTLFQQVTEFCEQRADQFALFLQESTKLGSLPSSITPVEDVIETVIAPLAEHAPVLAIVMDGMSLAVCYELLLDVIEHFGWIAIAPEHQKSFVWPGLATIPSVTEVSRTSLLSGVLIQGTSRVEQTKFSTHPQLLKRGKKNTNPVLFHKPDLKNEEDAGLAPEVRKAIADPKQQVVSVIVNAIDDHLHKDSQIDIRWTVDAIIPLQSLLYEAQQAQRLVIFLSDHGHVMESKTKYFAHDGMKGERWRSDTNELTNQELRIQGERVVIPDSHQLIAPWSEGLRYASKKNGYHGGLNPQEMLVPIVVISSTETYPPGWSERQMAVPDWWKTNLNILPKS
ncbi:MAG: BREX-2 system phosphatase PglZ [Prochlorotrichaceae cyanobacterium]